MNIVFNCPGCGAILRMKEEYGGRRGRCPHCQGAITVPAIESDAGMDLLPLEGASGDTSAPQGSSSPPAQSLGTFSAGSRFSLPAKQGAESLQGSSGGDSAIGLAPLEERNTKSPPPTAPAPVKTKSASPGTDSNLGLAPLEDHATSKPAHVAAAKPAAAAKSSAGESAIGLAPLEEVKEKAAPPKPVAKAASAAGGEEIGLAPLEGAAASKAAPATSPKGASATASTTTPAASPAEPRMTCGKCGAKMRIPPNAAGKNVVCPKCKNKMRVPDLASSPPSAAAKSDSDTIALSDTPSSGTDLGGGMLDMLGDDKLAGSGTAAAEDAGAGLSAPKLSAGKSKSGAIFGLPPVALYGGAAAVALVFALGLVYLLGGFSSSASQVAQTPGMPPAGQTPAAPPTGAPSPNPASAAPAQPQPSAPAPTMPTTPPTSAPVQPPGSFSAGLAGGIRNKAQAEAAAAGGAPPGTQPANASGAPAVPGGTAANMSAGTPPAADASGWKQRVPMVRSADSAPRAGETATPPADGKAPLDFLNGIQAAQRQIIENLMQVTDQETARRLAPIFAEQTAKGLDNVRLLRGAGGIPKPENVTTGGLRGKGIVAGAANMDIELVGQIENDLQRVNTIAGAMPILEAAIVDQARREPQGALAATLNERGVPLQAAPQ